MPRPGGGLRHKRASACTHRKDVTTALVASNATTRKISRGKTTHNKSASGNGSGSDNGSGRSGVRSALKRLNLFQSQNTIATNKLRHLHPHPLPLTHPRKLPNKRFVVEEDLPVSESSSGSSSTQPSSGSPVSSPNQKSALRSNLRIMDGGGRSSSSHSQRRSRSLQLESEAIPATATATQVSSPIPRRKVTFADNTTETQEIVDDLCLPYKPSSISSLSSVSTSLLKPSSMSSLSSTSSLKPSSMSSISSSSSANSAKKSKRKLRKRIVQRSAADKAESEEPMPEDEALDSTKTRTRKCLPASALDDCKAPSAATLRQ
mmetsp:Transcript_7267/g.21062  ORF Transcript_7267/g.21062 Transcript_7267/m.21062 type:complete len:319 (+) Transcript_7267:247-1203(+)